MDRGDVLVFNTNKEEYKDWKYFRAIETVTKENRTEESVDKQSGAKLYVVGNVLNTAKEVLKHQELHIGTFSLLTQKGEIHVADEADSALLFLVNKDF